MVETIVSAHVMADSVSIIAIAMANGVEVE